MCLDENKTIFLVTLPQKRYDANGESVFLTATYDNNGLRLSWPLHQGQNMEQQFEILNRWQQIIDNPNNVLVARGEKLNHQQREKLRTHLEHQYYFLLCNICENIQR